MLQQFTWQQFLVASIIISLIWYVGIILIFYRTELLGLFGKNAVGPTSERLQHRWEKDVSVLDETSEEEELMGKAKLPEGISSVGIANFAFAPTENDRADQIGLVPDVLQEIKEVFAILEKEDGTKNDFFNLMEVVKENYPRVGSNPNITHINQFISDHAPFHLSQEELENLWD